MIEAGKRVVVAMSGGVDSSVVAGLLKEKGCEVIGMTMQIWDYSSFTDQHGDSSGTCCSLDDVYDARRVAEELNIPFYVVNFEKQFEAAVIDRFCEDYFSGLTPNPCILCNQILKFEILLHRSLELEADYLVTGHYAQVLFEQGQFLLKKGFDRTKDQSYFLFTLTSKQMQHVRFPLGGMTKAEVRNHASRLGLKVAEKPESQDICFVPDGNYIRFLEEQRGPGKMDGDIVHVNGEILGRHRGTYRYTVGQRRGLGLSWPDPLYVVEIDARKRRVIVGERPFLSSTTCYLFDVNWHIEIPKAPFKAACKIRYRHKEAPALITPLASGGTKVVFDTPQFGITPGQAAVFYDQDRVLGGGWIESLHGSKLFSEQQQESRGLQEV